MLLVNYLAVCLPAFSAGQLAELFGVSPAYRLALVFYPGILLALDRDLTDVLSISLLVTSQFLLHYRRGVLAAVVLALALLTRETVVLLAGGLLADSLWRAIRGRSKWGETVSWTIPLAIFAGWQLWLFARWGKVAGLQRAHNDSSLAISRGPPSVSFFKGELLLGSGASRSHR
jgi:hypothetical protein